MNSPTSSGPPAGRQLITLRQVLARLQVSRTMLYRLMRRHRLVPVRIGRAVRFEAGAVDAFIDGLVERQREIDDQLRERYGRH